MSDNSIDWEYIQKTREEINKLIELKPELAALQQEIDERLSKCNSQHNRLVMIGDMMWESFLKLNKALVDFSSPPTEKKALTLVKD